jgi:hypothetical protein
MEEDVLGFLRCYPMPLPVLLDITIVPIESGTNRERVVTHVTYISYIYRKEKTSQPG